VPSREHVLTTVRLPAFGHVVAAHGDTGVGAGSRVGSALGSRVGSALGSRDGSALGSRVGSALGSAEGSGEGSGVVAKHWRVTFTSATFVTVQLHVLHAHAVPLTGPQSGELQRRPASLRHSRLTHVPSAWQSRTRPSSSATSGQLENAHVLSHGRNVNTRSTILIDSHEH
jgi:hypothetical protein